MKKLALALAATSLIACIVPTDEASAQRQPYGHGEERNHGSEQQRPNSFDQHHPGWGRDNRPSQHRWRRGQQMGYNDWHAARRIDYRRHHLRAPPRGYEWRERNGQYILGAIATGVIVSIFLNNR